MAPTSAQGPNARTGHQGEGGSPGLRRSPTGRRVHSALIDDLALVWAEREASLYGEPIWVLYGADQQTLDIAQAWPDKTPAKSTERIALEASVVTNGIAWFFG